MEFERTTSYFPIPALLQIRVHGQTSLIDLVALDLTNELHKFFKPLTCPILFFAGKQEVEILYHDYALQLNNVFDCQLAAIFLNMGDQLSYQALVHTITGIEVDKEQQRTNWLKRPLSQKQLNYAAIDVLHLEALYHYLYEQLVLSKKLSWFEEDCQSLAKPVIPNPDKAWQKFFHLRLDWQGFFAVIELARAREIFAITHNLSRGKVIENEVIEHVATALGNDTPINLNTFSVHRDFKETFHTRVADIDAHLKDTEACAITQHTITQMLERQRETILDRKFRTLNNALRKSIKDCATQYNMPVHLISNRQNLTAFVCQPNELSNPLRNGWRWQIFGKDAQQQVRTAHKALADTP